MPFKTLSSEQKVLLSICSILWICCITLALLAAFNVFDSKSSEDSTSISKVSQDIWSPVFKCVDTPGEDIQFYGLDLEDIQSLITESEAHKLLISGMFDDAIIEFEYVNNDVNILHETLLRGLAISTINYTEMDWDTKEKYSEMLHKQHDCVRGAYIPNIWFETCGNANGLHIIRNGSHSVCAFEKSSANVKSSTITIYLDTEPGLPVIDNEIETTVFGHLDVMEDYTKSKFPTLTFISSDEYIDLSSDPTSVCLIDARSDAEFAISRIEHAVNISMARIDDGALNTSDVLDTISGECGHDVDQLTFVTYCTLGVRAGDMATYLIQNLSVDASNVFVMAKAVSIWADERRRMVNDDGATNFVHTYTNDVGRKYILPKYRYCC